jgi:hypothetical protein
MTLHDYILESEKVCTVFVTKYCRGGGIFLFKPSLNVQTKMFRRVKTRSPLSHENPPAVTSFLPRNNRDVRLEL